MGTWNKDAMSGEEIHELYKKSVWALQILPGCTLVKGHSIADLALKAYAKVVPYLLQNKMDPLLQIGERIKPSGAEGRPKKEGFLDFLGLPKEQPDKEDEDEDAEKEKEKEGEGGEEVPLSEEEIKQREKTAKRKQIEEERRIEDAEKKRIEDEKKAQEEAVRAIEREKKYGVVRSVADEKRALRHEILKEINLQAANINFEQLGEWSIHATGTLPPSPSLSLPSLKIL